MMEKKQLLALLKSNRSYRRFDSSVQLSEEEIRSWIEALRYTASAKNVQPLKYRIITDKAQVDTVFSLLHWAAYLPDWQGPSPEERPVAFVIQVLDRTISASSRFDEGIQLEALTLMARSSGYGGCILAAFDSAKLSDLLSLNTDRYTPIAVVALGKPIEEVVIEDLPTPEGDIRYYRTRDKVHHVPKRTVDQLIF
ncbi:nitroreductase family protein [Porphyromonas sp.]